MKTLGAVLAGLILGAGWASATELSLGASAGYDGGPVVRVSASVDKFAKGLPLGLQASAGWSAVDPGNAADVRRIFINDATNGTPQKTGWFADARLDFTWDPKWVREGEVLLAGGPRYSFYQGIFSYVGGNEEFDIVSGQIGLGLGAEGRFPISAKLDFVLQAGLDYFFDAALVGHGTTYTPSGDNVNVKHTYSYPDADAAVNQPKLVPSVLVGLGWHL